MWYHHGSDRPTSTWAILHHTDPNTPNISGGSVHIFKWVKQNFEIPKKTHPVVHRLLKNLSFFYCCFSVKANPLNPRTSPLCSLSYLRTMVGRNSKLCQFWNYFNLMLFSYFVHMFNLDEDNILDLHGDLHHNKIDCLNMFDHKLSWLHVKLVRFRAIGTSENPGVPVVIRWAKSVPPWLK